MKLELKIPPLVVMIVCIAVVFLLHLALPILSLHFSAQAAIAALMCFAAATICAVAVLQCHFSGTTVDPRNPRATNELIISGVFRLSRNPMYLGFSMFISAAVLLTGNLVAIATVPIFVLYMNRFQIQPEELQLSKKFPQSFKEYQDRVRRWL